MENLASSNSFVYRKTAQRRSLAFGLSPESTGPCAPCASAQGDCGPLGAGPCPSCGLSQVPFIYYAHIWNWARRVTRPAPSSRSARHEAPFSLPRVSDGWWPLPLSLRQIATCSPDDPPGPSRLVGGAGDSPAHVATVPPWSPATAPIGLRGRGRFSGLYRRTRLGRLALHFPGRRSVSPHARSRFLARNGRFVGLSLSACGLSGYLAPCGRPVALASAPPASLSLTRQTPPGVCPHPVSNTTGGRQ